MCALPRWHLPQFCEHGIGRYRHAQYLQSLLCMHNALHVQDQGVQRDHGHAVYPVQTGVSSRELHLWAVHGDSRYPLSGLRDTVSGELAAAPWGVVQWIGDDRSGAGGVRVVHPARRLPGWILLERTMFRQRNHKQPVHPVPSGKLPRRPVPDRVCRIQRQFLHELPLVWR